MSKSNPHHLTLVKYTVCCFKGYVFIFKLKKIKEIMAKLHNYYVLCPLIDQHSFLGVSQDREQENVIVTLGRNVVNKYRVSHA